MKKTLLLVLVACSCMVAFCQRASISSSKGVCTDPAVAMTATFVGFDSFTIEFTPNAECDHYSYVAMTDAEISMWTSALGLTVEQLIPMWGVATTTADSHTWSDMTPNTTYKVLALPYDANSVSYTYSYIEVTTSGNGGSGTAVVSISVSDITANSAHVVCTPNAETSAFYDGLVTVDYFNEIGCDSACTVLRENIPSPYYSEDAWDWLSLTPNTQYYAIAFGQNADGIWGDTTIYQFQTLSDVAVTDFTAKGISVYPVPNNGNFVIAGDDLQGANALLYSMNGQLLKNISLSSNNDVSVSLPAGSYLLQIQNAEGEKIGQNVIVIR